MKKGFLSMLLVFAFFAAATAQKIPYDSVKKQIIYTEVVNVPGKTKDELYNKSMEVLAKIYNTLDNKIDLKDPAAGKIDLKCTTRVLLKDAKSGLMVPSGFIKYKLALQFKDGKYRYEFSDFHEDRGGFKYPMEKYYTNDVSVKATDRAPERLAVMEEDIHKVIKQLKDGIASTPEKKKDEW